MCLCNVFTRITCIPTIGLTDMLLLTYVNVEPLTCEKQLSLITIRKWA